MREDVVPAPEDSLEPETVALRRLLHDAGEVTALPGPLDVARAVQGGRRRRRRRQAGQALAGLAAATVLVGLVTLPGGSARSGPEPAAPSLRGTPDATGPHTDAVTPTQLLSEVLADRATAVSRVVFSDSEHASAVVSRCSSSCTAYAVITADGWRTWRAMPAGDGTDGIEQLPDGTALVGDSDAAGHRLVRVLRPDGSAALGQVSEVPTASGLLVPPLFGKTADGVSPWTYDRGTRVFRPLTGAPAADITYAGPVTMPDHSLVMLLARGIPPTSLTVARSTDVGRTWTTRTVRPHAAGATTVAGAAASPDGRLAVLFGHLQDDTSPFAELQTSSDGGRTWSVSTVAGGTPQSVDGVAVTATGSVFVSEDIERRLWRQEPGGPLTPATGAPPGQTALSGPTGVVSTQTSPRDVSWSTDGVHWRHWSLPTSVPDPGALLVAQPSTPTPAARAGQASQAAADAARGAHATPTSSLVPADGFGPAAGVCNPTPGHVVTVAVGPDGVSMPRCAHVHPDQILTVRNDSSTMGQRGFSITVAWPPFSPRTLAPGQETTFDRPFGTYLAVGHHPLPLGDRSGGELILDAR